MAETPKFTHALQLRNIDNLGTLRAFNVARNTSGDFQVFIQSKLKGSTDRTTAIFHLSPLGLSLLYEALKEAAFNIDQWEVPPITKESP